MKQDEKQLRKRLQLCVAEVIKLLEENKVQEALVVLGHADKLLDENGHLLSDNKQSFFNTNLGRFHDIARWLARSPVLQNKKLTITKEELLENSDTTSTKSSDSGKQEVEEENNNNSEKRKSCNIL